MLCKGREGSDVVCWSAAELSEERGVKAGGSFWECTRFKQDRMHQREGGEALLTVLWGALCCWAAREGSASHRTRALAPAFV